MPLFLCIDGGGTKTCAAIAFVEDRGDGSWETTVVQGYAGPSNL